jgi:hypothetical protein
MRRPKRVRGYALLFVMLLMVALGVVVGGLLAVLADSIASSRAAHEDLQQMYGCDGALRLALAEAERHAGDLDNLKLQAALSVLSAALPTDVNPRTGRPYADLSEIRVEPSEHAVLVATNLPFFGMEYVQESSLITVASNDTGGRGRSCRAEAPNRRRTISYFQFAVASTDRVENPTAVQATGGTDGDIFVLVHGQSGPRRSGTAVGSTNVHLVNLGGGDVFRPTAPSGQPWRFINKKKKFFGGNKRKKRARRPTLEALIKFPTDSPVPDPPSSRFVKGADIRIIDGEWFIPDVAGGFPGRKIWSDRSTAPTVSAPVAFSAYERESASGPALGGAAVIRYGLVASSTVGGIEAVQPAVRGFCAGDPDLFAPVTADGPECGAAAPVVAPTTGEPDPIRAAARVGFLDPSSNTPILPIVVDVAALAAAMQAGVPGDVGAFRCLGAGTVLCPDNKLFRGSVWIGTREFGARPNGTPALPCPLAAPGQACVRPNAVVLYNMKDLRGFVVTGEHGLSIASNLPMYVVGDVNSVTAPVTATSSGRDSRVALLAPQVTALSPSFQMTSAAWGTTPSIPSQSVTNEWNTSLFTGWATTSTTQRSHQRHVLRQIEGSVRVNLTGSIVVMFAREHYVQRMAFDTRKGRYSAVGDPTVAGLPIFLPQNDPDEAGSRLVSGTVRYPGDGTRDLRRSSLDKQPPNAPRLSIDLAPLDKR